MNCGRYKPTLLQTGQYKAKANKMNDNQHFKNYINETQAGPKLVLREPMTVEHLLNKQKRLEIYASDARNPKQAKYKEKLEQTKAVIRVLREEV